MKKILRASFLLLAAVGAALPTEVAASDRPNIVWVMADDLGYGALGCYGQEKVRTPHLDRMAAEGTRFTQCYAGSMMCAPSRCVLMTGLHAGHARVRANDPKQMLTDGDATVAEALGGAGYACGVFGKWGLGDVGTTGSPDRQGFDRAFGYLDQVHAHYHYPGFLVRDGKRVELPGNEGGRERYAPDLIAEESLAFVRENRDRPFFLYLATTIPHAELLVPEDSLREYAGTFPETPYVGDHYASNPQPRATYAAMVTRLDRQIGDLFRLLEELGLDGKTVVFFTSDNGPINAGGADPAFFGNAGSLRGLKFSFYEGGLRVPMLARWPGRVPAGRVSDFVWSHADLFPTACALAGAEAPAGLDGRSVVHKLTGDGNGGEPRLLYWEGPTRDGYIRAARLGRWKAVRTEGRPLELYDLDADPGEITDVAGRHPEVTREMDARLEAEHRPLGG